MARRWYGRRSGVFLAYVGSKGRDPLDRRPFLPEDWADDPARREQGHVPEAVGYRKTWEVAADLPRRGGGAARLGRRR